MNRPILELLVRSCVSVAASVILISSAEVTPANAAESFTPTMKDMLSIQGAIERYERGMDTETPCSAGFSIVWSSRPTRRASR